MAMSEGLSINEAAERLGVSARTVRRWIKAGRLQAEMVDGPHGPQYSIPTEAINTAQQIVDVVKVERPNDPEVLALAVAKALQERDARIYAALQSEFQERFDELASTLEENEQSRREREEERDRKLLEAIRAAQERKRRRWWMFGTK